MEQWVGLRGTALEWFWSYLAVRVDLKLDSQIRAVVRSSKPLPRRTSLSFFTRTQGVRA